MLTFHRKLPISLKAVHFVLHITAANCKILYVVPLSILGLLQITSQYVTENYYYYYYYQRK